MLRLTGLKIGSGYYTASTLLCPNPFIFNSLAFKLDTGCDVTTVSLNDALNSRIDFSRLGAPFDVLGIGGTVPTYAINNCILSFDLGNCVISEKMNQVYISAPVVNRENVELIRRIPSLLGIDFLQRYTAKYDNIFVYLER